MLRYFDGNATSPLCKEARDAWLEASERWWFNGSSPFREGAAVHVRLERDREELASQLGCEAGELIFNSGATEGNNHVFMALGMLCPENQTVFVSAVEHASVREPAKRYLGDRLQILDVDSNGVVDLGNLEELLKSGEVFAVSVMAANNETGVLQPWQKILEICQSHGLLYHCDAAQWIGKLPLEGLGKCHFVTGSAHKFGGPKGCGFLKYSRSVGETAFLTGGSQEGGLRAGTEDYPSIAAMMAALDSTEEIPPSGRDEFERHVKQWLPEVQIVGESVPRLAHTSMLILPEFGNDRWVNLLAKKGQLVSTGSACSTVKGQESQVLEALGYSSEEARRAVRVSGGKWTCGDSWGELGRAFRDVWDGLQEEGESPSVISVD